jgi:hypothetical protein
MTHGPGEQRREQDNADDFEEQRMERAFFDGFGWHNVDLLGGWQPTHNFFELKRSHRDTRVSVMSPVSMTCIVIALCAKVKIVSIGKTDTRFP